jgi:hypothetical protein
MRKTGKKREQEQSAWQQLRFPFHRLARAALWDTVVLSGFGFVQDELEAERSALCGERYVHQAQRPAVRAGGVPSWLVLGGRRVEIQRPGARAAVMVTNCACQAGRPGVRVIGWTNAHSSKWCRESPRGATRARWNRCPRRSRSAASARARLANGS